jgi:hypothetical protein
VDSKGCDDTWQFCPLWIRSLLCVTIFAIFTKPENLTTGEKVSMGGANVATWSRRKAFLVPSILGCSLTSEAVADLKCATEGQSLYRHDQFKMAEHHDGTGHWPGWSFWAEMYEHITSIEEQLFSTRYWVKINDQTSNPWKAHTPLPQLTTSNTLLREKSM